MMKLKFSLRKLLKSHKGKSFTNLSNILNSIDLLCLTNEQKEIGEKELRNALKSMTNNKSPGNDR